MTLQDDVGNLKKELAKLSDQIASTNGDKLKKLEDQLNTKDQTIKDLR